MNKKRLGILLLIIVISNIYLLLVVPKIWPSAYLRLTILSLQEQEYQVFYSWDKDWMEEQSEKSIIQVKEDWQQVDFKFPVECPYARIDVGDQSSRGKIQKIELKVLGRSFIVSNMLLAETFERNDLKVSNDSEGILELEAIGKDPYFIFGIPYDATQKVIQWIEQFNLWLRIMISVVFNLIALYVMIRVQNVLNLLKDLYESRKMLWELSKNDFKTKYAGSYLGIIWAFIQPMMTLIIYWLVFQYGLRASSPNPQIPFALWLMAGLVPWFFFQEALMNATNSLIEYSYLVKKVVFRVSILPIVKIISSFLVHCVFVMILLMVLLLSGGSFDLYMLQIGYYSICTFFLALGLSYATASIIIFFRDLSQIITIVLQIGMWMTPIMWSYEIVPLKYQWIIKLNPLYYIIEGFRDAMINHVGFWTKYLQTTYFWMVSLALFGVGTIIFKKLRPHFADVL